MSRYDWIVACAVWLVGVMSYAIAWAIVGDYYNAHRR